MRLVREVDRELNETELDKISRNDTQILQVAFKHCPGCNIPIEKVRLSNGLNFRSTLNIWVLDIRL